MGIFKNPWLLVIIFLTVVIALLISWGVGYPTGLTFIIAVFTIYIAGNTLDLTRANTRPFLNIKLNISIDVNPYSRMLVLVIENTGKLPADQVTIDCLWYIKNEELNKECKLITEKPIQSIVFPSEIVEYKYVLNEDKGVTNFTNKGSCVKIMIQYQNKQIKQQYTTKRVFRIQYLHITPSSKNIQAVVDPEEDYWD